MKINRLKLSQKYLKRNTEMPRIRSEQKNDANTLKHISFIKSIGLAKEA